MKVFHINSFGNLSTGKIAVGICKVLKEEGHDAKLAYYRNSTDENIDSFKFGNKLNMIFDGIATRITDKAGFYSYFVTKKLIEEIENYNPDIIHLHNLHGYYINVELLFKYLKKINKPVVWTLHDCWAFTGHCCYYSAVNCSKWQTICENCPQKNAYPRSFIVDNSRNNFLMKKKLFTNLNKLYLVTVSNWLKEEVSKSFFKDKSCSVIYNGIDLSIFKPVKSNFRKKYNLEDKFIILGVASTWSERKGLNDFIKLSKMLDSKYKVVLVGVNKKQKSQLPKNILAFERTYNIEELVEIYSSSDLFFNASVEETFGLPTVEALACKTPVIVYNSTAAPELVNKKTGYIVEAHDLNMVKQNIEEFRLHPLCIDNIDFEINEKSLYKKYLELYKKII